MGVLKKIYKITTWIIVALLFMLGLLLASTTIKIPGNFKALTVLSGSMESVIHTGSMVFIRPASLYKVGDIITFGALNKTQVPTTHRIVEIKGSGDKTIFVTKGDANNSTDLREVVQGEILGKAYFSIPYLGYTVDMVKKPMWFVVFIIISAVIIIYEELKKIWLEIKNLQKKKEQSQRVMLINVLDLRNIKKVVYPKKKESNQGWTAWLMVVIMFFSLGFAYSGYTFSYFNDTETSSSNTITIGVWDNPRITAPDIFTESNAESQTEQQTEIAPGETLGESFEQPEQEIIKKEVIEREETESVEKEEIKEDDDNIEPIEEPKQESPPETEITL